MEREYKEKDHYIPSLTDLNHYQRGRETARSNKKQMKIVMLNIKIDFEVEGTCAHVQSVWEPSLSESLFQFFFIIFCS